MTSSESCLTCFCSSQAFANRFYGYSWVSGSFIKVHQFVRVSVAVQADLDLFMFFIAARALFLAFLKLSSVHVAYELILAISSFHQLAA